MTPAEREELEQLRAEQAAIVRASERDYLDAQINAYRVPQWSAKDKREALPQCLATSFGLPVDDLHPYAMNVLRDGRDFTILNAAEYVLDYTYGGMPSRDGDGYGNLVLALGTADFPSIVQETMRGIAQERKSELLSSILALSYQLEVHNYKAESYSFVDLDNLPAPSADTMNEYTFANVRVTGEQIRAYSTFANILVPRQVTVDARSRNFLRAAVNGHLAAAHRNEMSTIVSLIEANANLSDGSPIFHADTDNLTVAPLNAAGLGTAFGTLRAQPTESGDASDANPATMLVHADDEAAALALVETLPTMRRPRVVATSRLTNADAWYLFADVNTYPVIARTRLEGADLSCVTFGGFTTAAMRDPVTGEDVSYNGVFLPATHSVGYSILSRVGAVKLTKT